MEKQLVESGIWVEIGAKIKTTTTATTQNKQTTTTEQKNQKNNAEFYYLEAREEVKIFFTTCIFN